MRRLVLLPLTLVLAGCPAPAPAPTPAASPTPIAGAVVNPFKLAVTAPADGVITVAGKAGSVYGAPATLVLIQVLREDPTTSPAPWRLLHLGAGGLPIGSASATLDAEGGFPATRVGAPERAVKAGDEINLTPYNGSAQAGFPVAVKVP